ncbi:MAG TPA: hypothetical protein VJ385_15000 [Fibrobacteria bacterium]|nr:hypothetical protein [Fibrobacteria bacterium]
MEMEIGHFQAEGLEPPQPEQERLSGAHREGGEEQALFGQFDFRHALDPAGAPA